VIGIDLGTTYSAVTVYQNGQSEVIINDMGNRITPSVVSFLGQDRLVGEAAKNKRS
jgi:heat shock protein 5